MVRVLQVVGKMHYGGMETFIMNIYRNIDRSRVQFDFLVHYEEPGDYDEEIRRLGGRIYVMPKTTPMNYFTYKKALEHFFKEHQEYKVIHGHLHSVAFMYHKIAKKYGKRFCITHAHNNGVEFTLKGIMSYFTSLMAQKYTDGHWGCSIEACRFFFPNVLRQGRGVKIVSNGIRPEKYEFQEEIRQRIREELQIKDEFVIGNVARFSKQKNPSFLIDIFYEIQKRNKDSILVLVGKGPDENKIRKKVKSKGLEGKVRFLGTREDVNQVMMAMDAFVFPSRFEGFGIALLEAQATGLPCFCTEKKVSDAAKISDLFNTISLREDAEFWAEEILDVSEERKDKPRQDYYKQVKRYGFDIQDIAESLEKQYIRLEERLEERI